MKAVHIQSLDEKKEQIRDAYASGFIVKEGNINYLYTCWHVVTGFDMHNVEIKGRLPNRKFLEVSFQYADKKNPSVVSVGGIQKVTLGLYDKNQSPKWIQDENDIPNISLNNIGIKVPYRHDVVKIKIDEEISVHDSQVIKEDEIFKNKAMLGDKVYIVGYPYGFSALGSQQPTPIVLTRFIAADRILNRESESLIDGPGAPGMSGGPVFIERNSRLYLFAIYNGLIYPDHVISKNDKNTALGTISNLVIWWFDNFLSKA